MIDTTKMIPIGDLRNSDSQDLMSIIRFATEAQQYLASRAWCSRVTNGWLDRGWDGVLAIFYFAVEPVPSSGADTDVWVIVGDLPPAYIDTSDCSNGAQALRAYVEAMRDWIEHVRLGLPLEEIIPVNAPAEPKYADLLEARLNFIEREFLSSFSSELGDAATEL